MHVFIDENRQGFQALLPLSLMLAPLAFLVGTLVHPGLDPAAADQLQLIEEHPDRWYATHVLGLLFIVFAIPAVFVLGGLLPGSGARLGRLGAALSVVGLVSWTGVVTIYGFVAWQMSKMADRSQMAALFEELNHTAAVAMPFRIGPMAFALGMLCLAVALYRAGAVGKAQAVAIAAGPAIFGLGALASFLPMMILGTLQMTLGMGSVGLGLLRGRSDPAGRVKPGAP